MTHNLPTVEECNEAQARVAELIKSRFLADYRETARKSGFDLDAGDVAIVHEDDVPLAVTLVRGRDPVWINSRLVEPGKTLLVDRKRKHLPIYHRLNG